MSKVLINGNTAIAEGAIRGGCRYYFGYPITPQNELIEYMAKNIEKVGGVFIQTESELAAIYAVYGAASAGGRAMTTSSSPGISLMQEGISYLVGAELPAVIVNVMRGGPGLGGIGPSQSDYFQSVKGGGHGDYNMVVLAPASGQECADFAMEAFDIADKYRNPVMILSDGLLGRMMEPVELKEPATKELPKKDWAVTGCKDRKPNVIRSLFLDEEALEKHNIKLQEKFKLIGKNEVRWEEMDIEGAEVVLVAYGTSARICKGAMELAKNDGRTFGLFRPVSLWPFPRERLMEISRAQNKFFVVEMSAGQMIEDVQLSVAKGVEIGFHGRLGGQVPSPEEVYAKIKEIY